MTDNSAPHRILHLEDSARDAALIADLLDAAGGAYEIVCAAGRQTFTAALDGAPFDLILCDFDLPDFDGLSALKLARAQRPDTPVIIVSGAIDAEAAVKCLQGGATDYLLKQRLERLPSAVERALAAAAAERQRRQAERQNALLHARNQALVRALAEIVYEWWPQRDEVRWDGNFTDVLGYSPAEIGRDNASWTSRIHPDDLNPVLAELERACRERRLFEMEYRFRRRDGSYAWMHDRCVLTLDAAGEIAHAIGVFSDITRRKQTEHALQLFRAQVDGVNDAIEVIDPATARFLDVNERGCLDLGYTRAELLALTVADIDPLMDTDAFARHMAELEKSGTVQLESLHRRKDGSTFPVEVSIKRVRLERDYLVTVVRDITARKRADDALREKEHRLSESQRIAHIGSWQLDLDGRVTWSDETYRIHGFSPGALPLDQEAALNLIHPADRPAAAAWVVACLAGEKPGELEYRIVLPDGSERFLSGRGELVLDAAGRPRFMAGTVQDITERKRAEDARMLAEEKYRQLFENLVAGIFRSTPDGHYLEVNSALARMYGYASPAAMLAAVSSIQRQVYVRPERRQEFVHQMEQYGQVTGFESEVFYQDGSIIWISETAHAVRDAHGQVLHYDGIVENITARKRAEQARRESDERFRAVAENLGEGLVLTDLHDLILDVNPRLLELTGYARAELVGRPGYETLNDPADAAEMTRRNAERAAGLTGSYELKLRRKDGTRFDAEITGAPLRNSHGEIFGAVGVIHDISARKQTEAVLRTLSTEAAGLMDTAFFQFVARRLAETFGVEIGFVGRLEEARPDHIQTLALWQENQFLPDFLYSLAGTPCENVLGRELCVYPADVQAQFPRDTMLVEQGIAAYAAIPLQDAAGRPLGLLGVMSRQPLRDPQQVAAILTLFAVRTAAEIERQQVLVARERTANELRQAKAALEAERAQLAARVAERTKELTLANAELDHANRLKSEFLANMSHELRTPLNAILGLSEALLEQIGGPLTPRQLKSLTTISESGTHLLALINDILDLSKIEAGKLELNLALLNVGDFCESALAFIRTQAMKKHLTVQFECEPRVSHLQADAKRLRQILVNLLTNAVKFTPDGGRIGLAVTAPANGDAVCFTVWDTGIGIAAEDFSRLFHAFTQLDSGLARTQEGTGLGLAMVAKLVELHGGSVALESEPGRGSRFIVTLPWSVAPPPAPRHPSAAPEFRHALIIDDDPKIGALLMDYLIELGFRSVLLGRGDEVMDTVLRERPDVILLDIQLPGASGWDVLQQLKTHSQTHDIPVLVVAGVNDPERSRALGAAAHLTKPFTRGQFVEMIRHSVVRQPAPVAPPAPPPARPSGPVILLAEDNEANIETLGGYLEAKGFQMRYAANGVAAVTLARELRPAAILMDIQMPVLDGLSAIRQIRADAALQSIPIVALTGLAMPGERERCLAAGAVEYLSKPVRLKELVALIENLLPRAGEGGGI